METTTQPQLKTKADSNTHRPATNKARSNLATGDLCLYDICPNPWLATPSTIAMMAATLARNSNDSPEVLADAAMKLFYASVERVITADYCCEKHLRHQKLDVALGANLTDIFDPLSETYPLSRDEFLASMFPELKSSPGELAALATSFLAATLRATNGVEPTFKEVNQAYRDWKPCGTFLEANALADLVFEWHDRHTKENGNHVSPVSSPNQLAV